MVSSRKSRTLALSAILLTLVFIFITTHNTKNGSIVPKINNQSSHTVETTTKLGTIDESAIKSQEEKLKQKLKQSIDNIADSKNGIQPEKLQDSALSDSRGSNIAAADPKGSVKANKAQSQTPSSSSKDSTNSDESSFDPAEEFKSILGLSPVVIFSKTYCGFSKTLKNLLSTEYEITPSPAIVELDKHKHGRELQDFIAEKTGRKTIPNLFVGGVSRGGSDEIKELHQEGKLLSSLTAWGNKNIQVSKISAPSNS